MKKVAILMSTFNGEKYIDEQISSILGQKGVEIHLWIRDDGSNDKTVAKIRDWAAKNPKKISFIEGENIGYRKSFLKLNETVPNGYDYYGFSDQDDVWHLEKCISAVHKLEEVSSDLKLYTSNLNIVDENLRFIYKTNMEKNYNMNLYSYWVRARFAGCTYLFSESLKNKAANYTDYADESITDHDFLIGTMAFMFGEVIFDRCAYIEHRRREESVTSGGKGALNRLRTEIGRIFKSKSKRYVLSKQLLANEKDMDLEYRDFFEKIAKYKDSISSKIVILKDKRFTSGNITFDMLTKLKVVFSTY